MDRFDGQIGYWGPPPPPPDYQMAKGDLVTVVDLDRVERLYLVTDIYWDDAWTKTVSVLPDPDNA
jgi:hypothetical protein